MKVVVVGYGPGGVTAAVTAKTFEPKTEVKIITEETIAAHRKPGSSMAIEHPDTSDLDIPDWSVEALTRKGVDVIQGVSVIDGDTDARRLTLKDGDCRTSSETYDTLILATGGLPLVPEILGTDLRGVYTMQNMADASLMGKELHSAKTVVVIGAGFSGLEAAERLQSMGKDVHLIVRSRLLRRQLEPEMSRELMSRLPASLHVHCGVEPRAILGSDQVRGIKLDKEEILTDAVLFMTGVRPNTKLAKSLGIRIGPLGGVVVDSRMETSVRGIFAVGDCIEMPDSYAGMSTLMPIGSVAARAGRQAGAVAVGNEKVYDDTSLRFQYDRVFGTDVVCAGLSSEVASAAQVEVRVTMLEDKTEFAKAALLTDKEGFLIGGQVITSRMGAILGYQILERIRSHARVDEHPILEPAHDRLKEMLERTLGPIR